MKTLFAFVLLCTFSMSLALRDASGMPDVREDEDEPQSAVVNVKLNNKVYQCSEDMSCDCPKLLCTGQTTCQSEDDVALPHKCKLTKPHQDINLQNAHRSFFFKNGDCRCDAA